jgi:hypothetical protein
LFRFLRRPCSRRPRWWTAGQGRTTPCHARPTSCADQLSSCADQPILCALSSRSAELKLAAHQFRIDFSHFRMVLKLIEDNICFLPLVYFCLLDCKIACQLVTHIQDWYMLHSISSSDRLSDDRATSMYFRQTYI